MVVQLLANAFDNCVVINFGCCGDFAADYDSVILYKGFACNMGCGV